MMTAQTTQDRLLETNASRARVRGRRALAESQRQEAIARATAERVGIAAISVAGLATDARIDTPWGTLVALRPAVVVTPEYQRHLRPNRVRRMAREFDPRLYGVILVAMRDDRPQIIDGQHRVAAAIQAGHADTPMPAMIVQTASYTEEAALFVQANRRDTTVPAATGEVFHARLEQGDARAEAIRETVEGAGFVLDLHMDMDGDKAGIIRAIATLERIFKLGGPTHLADVLVTLSEVYGEDRRAMQHDVLMGMHQFLYRYHDIVDRDRLALVLRPIRVDGLQARTLLRRMADGMRRGDSGLAMGMTIREVYTESTTPGSRLPAWETRPAPPNTPLMGEATYFPRPQSVIPKGRK